MLRAAGRAAAALRPSLMTSSSAQPHGQQPNAIPVNVATASKSQHARQPDVESACPKNRCVSRVRRCSECDNEAECAAGKRENKAFGER